jgi:hypothetical protein
MIFAKISGIEMTSRSTMTKLELIGTSANKLALSQTWAFKVGQMNISEDPGQISLISNLFLFYNQSG